MRKCVVLFSGGLDSSTLIAYVKNLGFAPYCLTFDYGQKHKHELIAAKNVIDYIGGVSEHKILSLDLDQILKSALISKDIKIRSPGSLEDIKSSNEIPTTYVPARNIIFLSIALGYAESIGCSDIFIGVNVVDYSGYPDCRPEFLEQFEKMANLGTKNGVNGISCKIHSPFLNWSKEEIIREGLKLNIDYKITISCYNPDEKGTPCKKCDACVIRDSAFENIYG